MMNKGTKCPCPLRCRAYGTEKNKDIILELGERLKEKEPDAGCWLLDQDFMLGTRY